MLGYKGRQIDEQTHSPTDRLVDEIITCCLCSQSLVDSAIMEQPNQLKLAHTISSFNKTVLCLKVSQLPGD